MKIIRTIALAFTIVIVIILVCVLVHDLCLKPFSGYRKEFLYSNEGKEISQKYIEKFYVEFLDVAKYEENYETDFYYCLGKKAFLSPLEDYASESYSFVIKFDDDDYSKNMDSILSQFDFLQIPIGRYNHEDNKDFYYIQQISVEDEIFFEIDSSSIFPHYYEWDIRYPSTWISYNDKAKTVRFSLIIDMSLDYYTNQKSLASYLKRNLFE